MLIPLQRAMLMFLLLVAFGSRLAAAEQDHPNVILVMTDDQGYGELSCHGNPVLKTPHLDRLHEQSIRLTDFHVAPMCTPTRGQLMTGVDALRNGAMNVSSGRTLLRRHLPTMADVFAASGYRTGLFGKWHLGDNYPFRPQDRGFQETLWFPSSHISSVPDYWCNDYFDDVYMHNGQRQRYAGYCTDVFFDAAMTWIRGAGKQQPFFAYIPANAPHGPHFVPEKYRAPVAAALDAAGDTLSKLAPGQRPGLISFLAMIANIDENMGRLETFLDAEGLRNNTLVVFLTDNGSTMGPRYFNAGMKGGKTTLWEGGHRVPCFIRWPGGNLRKPGDIGELTQVQDLLPTLIDVCRLSSPTNAQFDGASLGPLLRGEAERLPDRMLVVNYSRMPSNRLPSRDSRAVPKREGAAVLWKHWRLLEDKELYDLDSDPHQDRNVIEEHPEVVAQMRSHLDRWWDGVKAEVNTPSRVIIGSPREDPQTLTACEWFDVFVDQQRQVRAADRKNGIWHLEVDAPGTYTFELRRWPREANLPLTAGHPETRVTDGTYARGVALPIGSAQIRIGDQTRKAPVDAEAVAATFQLELPAGPTELQTWFLDRDGKELVGAYYVYVACAQADDSETSKRPDYLAIVRAYADAMLNHGRDTYGPEHSPLFAEALDRGTMRLPEGDALRKVAEISRSEWGIRPSDRMLGGANPQHCENLYQVLYALSEVTGEKRYADEADRSLKFFFEHCQSPATGLLYWGEHAGWDFRSEKPIGKPGRGIHEFYRPWVLWQRSWRLAPEPCRRFALGLWEHQIGDQKTGDYSRHAAIDAHGPATDAPYARHGGFYIETWATAYEKTRDATFLKAIETVLDGLERARLEEGGMLGSGTKLRGGRRSYDLSLAVSLGHAAGKMPPALAEKMQKIASANDAVFAQTLAAASDPATKLAAGNIWHNAYGSGPLVRRAALYMLRHRQVGLDANRGELLNIAQQYLGQEIDLSEALWPGTMGSVIILMLDAHELTGQGKYLDAADRFARKGIELYLGDGCPLPKASQRHDHYEAATNGDTLMMALLRLWQVQNRPELKIELISTDR